jgi:hypothetical protein
MRNLAFVLAAGVAVLTAPASAAVIGDFGLNGTTANAAGGALTLTNNGGTLGANGITFAANQGPTISGFASPAAYSVEMAFSLDTTSGYRKLLDFSNLTLDAGFYNLSGYLNFYPVLTAGTPDFTAGVQSVVVLTHDGTTTSGYVNGVQRWTFAGSNNSLANISSVLQVLQDDHATGQREASGGFLDYLRVYDTALSAEEVGALTPPGAVPEPASWALMLTGFGLAGVAIRRQRARRMQPA